MATTQADYDALVAAMNTGAMTVKYQDRQVTYRTIDEMIRLKKIMADELKISPTSQQMRENPVFSKGL